MLNAIFLLIRKDLLRIVIIKYLLIIMKTLLVGGKVNSFHIGHISLQQLQFLCWKRIHSFCIRML